MKRILAILLLTLMMLSLTACATKQSKEVAKGSKSRMVVVEETADYKIVYDKGTKVMYAVSHDLYNSGTFTLLVDKNGNPLLYEK